MSTRGKKRLVLLLVLALVAMPASLVAWRRTSGNFGVVIENRVFRSAQLDSPALTRTVRAHGIKTVLNLRGPNPSEDWYRNELGATLRAGAVQVDVPLASDQWLSIEQALSLLDLFNICKYPLLIHCEFGAERTGLVSALAVLASEGGTIEDARRQFSIDYLFVALKEGRVMQGHLEAYERWLRQSKRPHSPEALRSWIVHDYQPGSPSREYWPCNPYPLWVITTPGQLERQESWSRNTCPQRVAVSAVTPVR
jgi:hypothetical protein